MFKEPLVSVIIPCYNAEQWIEHAINSCLAQNYSRIEIIVIDDGSTDGSLLKIQEFESQIKWETGINQGGNSARNRGFTLSNGEYIQFLDADDYILPEKISSQVAFLEETKADCVYGDWRHQFHEPDGRLHLGDIVVSQAQEDVLESLLAGWWVAPVALLFRRQTVIESGGWDESLKAAQDKDFFISVAMTDANIQYQPGCYSIYRRYGSVTVSTSNQLRWLEYGHRVLEKAEMSLLFKKRLTPSYRKALAKSYFYLARNYYNIDYLKFQSLLTKTLSLDEEFTPDESELYNKTVSLLGYPAAEYLASFKRRIQLSRKVQ